MLAMSASRTSFMSYPFTTHLPIVLFGLAVALVLLAATGLVVHAQPIRGQFVTMVSSANNVVVGFTDSAWSNPFLHDVQNGVAAASSLGGVMSAFKASYGDNNDVHGLAVNQDLEQKRIRQMAFAGWLGNRRPTTH